MIPSARRTGTNPVKSAVARRPTAPCARQAAVTTFCCSKESIVRVKSRVESNSL